MKRKELRFEHGDGLRCEAGHRLYKVYEPDQRYAHMLLCRVCDNDVIEKMEKETSASPPKKETS